ncbi:MAG: phosphatidate cytidylyltransferase, partial [Desulfobulbaceae bacterium]|nr:phosphatidate cytidylyltransferase [Desulfobulbaceae bacterium]
MPAVQEFQAKITQSAEVLTDVNAIFPLILILALWASDIAAYFLGKTFGKKLLVPRISPKKT